MKLDAAPSTSSSIFASTPALSSPPCTKLVSSPPSLSIKSDTITPKHSSPTTSSDATSSLSPTPSSSTSTCSEAIDAPDLRTPEDIETYYRELEVHGLFTPSSSHIIMDDDVLQLASLYTVHEILEHLNQPGGKVLVSAKAVEARVKLAAERMARRRRVGVEAVVKGLEKGKRESGVLGRERVQRRKKRGEGGGGVVFPGLGSAGGRDENGGVEVEAREGVTEVEGEGDWASGLDGGGGPSGVRKRQRMV